MKRFSASDLERLAKLPLAYLAEQEELFDCCRKEDDVDERYRDIFILGIWAYQLHTYLELVGRFFGGETEREVRQVQMQILEREGGARRLLEQSFALIKDVVESELRMKPIKSEGASIETNIAMALLLEMPASPDYARTLTQYSAGMASMGQNTDAHFSSCLGRGRARILHVFDQLLTRPID